MMIFTESFVSITPELGELATKLQQEIPNVKYTLTKTMLIATNGNNGPLFSVPLSSEVFMAMVGGTFDPTKLDQLSIYQTLVAVFSQTGYSNKPDEPPESAPVLETKTHSKPVNPEYFDLNILFVSPTVLMHQATKMLQPVQGTTENSRYFVVSLSEGGPKIALRLIEKGDGLSASIRIDNIQASLKNALKEAGFLPKKSGHFSLHFDAANYAQVYGAVGALHGLCSMNHDMSPLPGLGLMGMIVQS